MIKNLYALVCGLLFGFGLIIAQMTNPDKVKAFLDVAGDWDPSLALVMASALLVLGLSQRLFLRADDSSQTAEQPGCALPKSSGISSGLIIGAAIFGIGWGLSGICPGPGIVGLSGGLAEFYVFVGAMFAGFYLFKTLHGKD